MKASAFAALLCCACAEAVIHPRPALVVEESTAPFEWRTDLHGGPTEVRGESCRNAIGLPLFLYGGWDLGAWGESGYRDAVAQAQAQAPGKTLSDVRVDVRFLNVLIFRQECLQITAAAR